MACEQGRKKWKGEGNLVMVSWGDLQCLLEVAGDPGQPAKHRRKHTAKNEWLQCTGGFGKTTSAPRWLRSSP